MPVSCKKAKKVGRSTGESEPPCFVTGLCSVDIFSRGRYRPGGASFWHLRWMLCPLSVRSGCFFSPPGRSCCCVGAPGRAVAETTLATRDGPEGASVSPGRPEGRSQGQGEETWGLSPGLSSCLSQTHIVKQARVSCVCAGAPARCSVKYAL